MSDLGWLRHLGQRTKTPDLNPDEPNSLILANQIARSPRRIRPPAAVRRVSSLLSLSNIDPLVGGERRQHGLSRSPSISSFAAPSKITAGDNGASGFADLEQLPHQPGSLKASKGYGDGLDVPEAERTWHNPNVNQMIKTLQVAMMMKRDALEPLPIRFNSHILVLLEGYSKQRCELAEGAQKIAEVQDLRERELEQFRAISDEWLKREDGYQAEIKRLELQLADTEKGMGAVLLARSGSLVDRGATARKRFEERVKRLSSSKITDGEVQDLEDTSTQTTGLTKTVSCHKTIGSMALVLDPEQDRLLSEHLKPKKGKSLYDKLKHRRPSGAAQQPEQDATSQENMEGRATYVPKGAPTTSRRHHLANVELPAYYQGGANDSSTSSSARSSEYTPNPDGKIIDQKGKIVARRRVQTHERLKGDHFLKLQGKPQATDDTRRFSFAAGQDDTLPVSSTAAAGLDGDGASDGLPTSPDCLPSTFIPPENWPSTLSESMLPFGDITLNPAIGASRLAVPRKSGSSSSRGTVVRNGRRDSSRSQVTVLRDSWSDDKPPPISDGEMDMPVSRLDAQPSPEAESGHDKVVKGHPYLMSQPPSTNPSNRQPSIQSKSRGNPGIRPTGGSDLDTSPPRPRGPNSKSQTIETSRRVSKGSDKVVEGTERTKHAVLPVDPSPSPSVAVRGKPTVTDPPSIGSGRGRSAHDTQGSPTPIPTRPSMTLSFTPASVSRTSPTAAHGGPTSPGLLPTSPLSQGGGGGASQAGATVEAGGSGNAARIAAALAVARGQRREPSLI